MMAGFRADAARDREELRAKLRARRRSCDVRALTPSEITWR